MLCKFCSFMLSKVFRWEIVGDIPKNSKSVVAVMPHTSYWDGVLGFFMLNHLNVNYRVMSAEWLHFFPFKYVMRFFLHAFPVGKHSGNAIKKSIEILSEENVNLVICPEGHLKKISKWPMGFYLIAKKADVPIDFVVFNYDVRKVYIKRVDISGMSKSEVVTVMNYLCQAHAKAKHPEKFTLCEI